MKPLSPGETSWGPPLPARGEGRGEGLLRAEKYSSAVEPNERGEAPRWLAAVGPMREEALRVALRTDCGDFNLVGWDAGLDQCLLVRRPQVESLPALVSNKQARPIRERLDDVLADHVAARANRWPDPSHDVLRMAAKPIVQRLNRCAGRADRAATPTRVDCRHDPLLRVRQQDGGAVGIAQHQRLFC